MSACKGLLRPLQRWPGGVRRRKVHSHSFLGEIGSLEMEKHFGNVSTESRHKVY